MFVGHFALGLGAKRLAPAVSLGTLLIACQAADLIWPNLVLLGIERLAIVPGDTVVTPLQFQSYPYSHSLLTLVIWGALAAGLYRLLRPASSLTTFFVIAGLVLSHWVLDVASHRSDMPLAPAQDLKLGLGLWNSLPGTIAVEMAMLLAGVAIYLRSTSARDRIGVYAFWGLIAVLVAIYFANLFGPVPPSPTAVAWSAQGIWLFVAWAYWIDRHRLAKVAA